MPIVIVPDSARSAAEFDANQDERSNIDNPTSLPDAVINNVQPCNENTLPYSEHWINANNSSSTAERQYNPEWNREFQYSDVNNQHEPFRHTGVTHHYQHQQNFHSFLYNQHLPHQNEQIMPHSQLNEQTTLQHSEFNQKQTHGMVSMNKSQQAANMSYKPHFVQQYTDLSSMKQARFPPTGSTNYTPYTLYKDTFAANSREMPIPINMRPSHLNLPSSFRYIPPCRMSTPCDSQSGPCWFYQPNTPFPSNTTVDKPCMLPPVAHGNGVNISNRPSLQAPNNNPIMRDVLVRDYFLPEQQSSQISVATERQPSQSRAHKKPDEFMKNQLKSVAKHDEKKTLSDKTKGGLCSDITSSHEQREKPSSHLGDCCPTAVNLAGKILETLEKYKDMSKKKIKVLRKDGKKGAISMNKRVDKPIKPWPCNACDRQFDSKRGLIIHLKHKRVMGFHNHTDNLREIEEYIGHLTNDYSWYLTPGLDENSDKSQNEIAFFNGTYGMNTDSYEVNNNHESIKQKIKEEFDEKTDAKKKCKHMNITIDLEDDVTNTFPDEEFMCYLCGETFFDKDIRSVHMESCYKKQT